MIVHHHQASYSSDRHVPISATSISTTPRQSINQMVWQQAKTMLNRMRCAVQNGSARPLDFERADEALRRLPMAAEPFGLARRRLHNAEVYCGRGEGGAALFELGLLVKVISRESECTTIRQPVKSLC